MALPSSCLGGKAWIILGFYWDNGKENGNYYTMTGLGFRWFRMYTYSGYFGTMDDRTEITGITGSVKVFIHGLYL